MIANMKEFLSTNRAQPIEFKVCIDQNIYNAKPFDLIDYKSRAQSIAWMVSGVELNQTKTEKKKKKCSTAKNKKTHTHTILPNHK